MGNVISSLVPPAARAEEACLQRILGRCVVGVNQPPCGTTMIYPPLGATITTNGSGKTVIIQTHSIEELFKIGSDSLQVLVGEFAFLSANTIDTLKDAWIKH
jgi:hypothetical protein